MTGGTATLYNLILGLNANTGGTLTMNGSGASLYDHRLCGRPGCGGTSPNVGRHPQSAGDMSVATYAGSTGTVNLNGGVLSVHSLAAGAGTATFNFGGGTLQAPTPICPSLCP